MRGNFPTRIGEDVKAMFAIMLIALGAQAQEKKYIDIGANPVARTGYWDPKSECLVRVDSDIEVETADRAGKRTTGWLHKGENLVVDKTTHKALRIQYCSNPLFGDFVPTGTVSSNCEVSMPAGSAAPTPPAPMPVASTPAPQMRNSQTVEVVIGGDADAKGASEKEAKSQASGAKAPGEAIMANEQRVRIVIPWRAPAVLAPAPAPAAAPAPVATPPPPAPVKKVSRGKGKAWLVLAALAGGGAIAAVAFSGKSSSPAPAPVTRIPPPPVLPPAGTSYRF